SLPTPPLSTPSSLPPASPAPASPAPASPAPTIGVPTVTSGPGPSPTDLPIPIVKGPVAAVPNRTPSLVDPTLTNGKLTFQSNSGQFPTPKIPAAPTTTLVDPASPPPTTMPTTITNFHAPELGVPDTRPGKQEPTVSIEWIAPANARFNQPIVCQIVVRNDGQSPVHQVTVKPNLPTEVKIKLSEPPIDPNNGDWSLGSLAPGQMKKIDVTLLSNRRGYQNYTANVTFAARTVHLTEVREPLLQLKVKGPDKGMVGEAMPITFAIHNPGDGSTDNVKVRAVLPEGIDHPRGQTFEIEVGNLAPKETRTLQLACIGKSPGKMKASLIATADGGLSSSDGCDIEVVLPRLDLALRGPKLRFVERPARYTLKLSNPGSATAANVVLNEVVPAGFKYHGSSNQGRFDEATRTVQWNVGDLPAGQNREITFDLIPTVPGDHRLAATVESARGIRSESTVQTRVEGLSNLILDVANADNPVEVGSDATYEIRVANGGTKAETNLELSCTLPENVEFKNARSDGGSKHRVNGREVVFEAIPRLNPRSELIYRVTVRGRVPADVRFRARLRADGQTDVLMREETTKFYDDNAVR
ncbi:MAG TPA: hypothetical protein VHR72_12040, partial [Gemmataceae bacterium]|nr:hypothetical protein [Gemmataceae bacterium]